MPEHEAKALLYSAKKKLDLGIYAISKDHIIEFVNIKCNSRTQVKKIKQQLKEQGFKVYTNGL